jgi:hypothetical protein
MKLTAMTIPALYDTQRDVMHSLRRDQDVLNYLPSHTKQCRCSEINPDPVYSCHIPCDLCKAKRDVAEWAERLTAVNREIALRLAAF